MIHWRLCTILMSILLYLTGSLVSQAWRQLNAALGVMHGHRILATMERSAALLYPRTYMVVGGHASRG
jgi:hypothetical protein